jgi:hypothetical protein
VVFKYEGKSGDVVHVWNPGTREVEAGRLLVQGQTRLDSKLKASLGYIVRLYLKKKKKEKRNGRKECVQIGKHSGGNSIGFPENNPSELRLTS